MKQDRLNKFLRKTISSLLLANALLVVGVDVFLGGIHQAVSPRISTKAELEGLLNVERKKAGISEDVVISADFGDESCSKKIKDKTYGITLQDGYKNMATLRHELYHIARGHCDRLYSSGNSRLEKLGNAARYLWLDEPEAIIYSATGVKL